jgi:hypothetical protein
MPDPITKKSVCILNSKVKSKKEKGEMLRKRIIKLQVIKGTKKRVISIF